MTGDRELVIDTSLSSKRYSLGESELEKLHLAENISFSQIARGRFLPRKIFNMLIRVSTSTNVFLKSNLFKSPLLVICSKYFSHVFHEKIKIVLDGSNVKRLSRPETFGLLFIGYFQAYEYVRELEMFVGRELISKESSTEVEKVITSKGNKTILVIHLRLGDYLNEEKFGIPSSNYYKSAFNKILSTVLIDECWVFSNDIETAKGYLQDIPRISLKWFYSVGANDAHLLMAMTQGDHFVIGNSTFSWWAANLAKNPTKIIVAPEPWFKGLPEPSGLIPPSWWRIDAKF